jgi:hypothetical protein
MTRRKKMEQMTSYYQESSNRTIAPLLEKLELTGDHKTKLEPYFTGWKELLTTPTGQAVGQIVQWLPKKEGQSQRAAWVNLPGMERGFVEAGACFDIGEKRIDLANPPNMLEVEAMLIQGLSILKELVETEK